MLTEDELKELQNTFLTGLTVGVGSQILLFNTGATVLIQCRFEREDHNGSQFGHGHDLSTAPLIFDFLNQDVEDAVLEEDGTLVFSFGNKGKLRILPDGTGLESYVVSTKHGIVPFY